MEREKDEQRCQAFCFAGFSTLQNSSSSGVLFSPGKVARIKSNLSQHVVNVLLGCSGEWKAGFICEMHRMQFQTFDHLCVTCLQMSTLLLNDCQIERRKKKKQQFDKRLLKGVLVRVCLGYKSGFLKVWVCVCVFRFSVGVDLVTLPAAVMLIAIQVVVRCL